MNLLAKALLRIAVELEEGFGEDWSMPAPRYELNSSERRRLTETAREIASNLGDGTSLVEKAMEYMREGYGDEYYDYDRLQEFFSILGQIGSFEGLRTIGLDDVAHAVETALNEIVPLSEDDSDDLVAAEGEFYICNDFGKACKKYVRSAIAEVTDEASESLSNVIENLINAFFGNDVLNFSEIIGKYYDLGFAKAYQFLKVEAEKVWKEFYNESGATDGNVLRYLYDVGKGAQAYSRSLKLFNVELKKRFSEKWKIARQTSMM